MKLIRKYKFWGNALLLLSLTSALKAQESKEWWNDDWSGRMKVVINAAQAEMPADVSEKDVPVLVRLHSGNFDFSQVDDRGSDIRFVAADNTTILKHHIEKFDYLLQEAIVWVQVPSIAKEEQQINLYFNKTGAVERAEDLDGTYDDSTVLVYHFAENGSAPADSSGSGNHASNNAISVAGSLIGGGARLTGNSPVIIPDSPTLAWGSGSAVSVSMWVSPMAESANAVILSRGDASNSLEIGLNNGIAFASIMSQGVPAQVSGAEATALQSWVHIGVVLSGSELILYRNGQEVNRVAASMPSLSGEISLGASRVGNAGFSGEIDELHIATVVRSAAWFQIASTNQGNSPKAESFLSLLNDAGGKSSWLPQEGYVGVILNSVDTFGWGIIMLLALMSAGSLMIMLFKIIYLNSIAGINHKFIAMWKKVGTDLTVLDNPEQVATFGGKFSEAEVSRLKRAPIFRLYHTGIEEIRHRFDAEGDHQYKRLSGASLQAIRSSIDASYVRQTRRLNSMIVYLTLAISGGPFLGLFGTVVGVAMTFGAIAAAGDVNINTIAPGVAAALLTTVAGLIVAIPALFGYNYIVVRIKEVTSEMRVFIDEFISKSAEFYSKKEANKNFQSRGTLDAEDGVATAEQEN